MLEARFQLISEASDGLEAVRQAEELRPDVVLLDIGLPKLNGIEAARQIRKLSPQAKIIFISDNRDWDIAEEALRTGAVGYVVKSDSRTELIPAIRVVLAGKQFISARFGGQNLTKPSDEQHPYTSGLVMKHMVPAMEDETNRHEVAFYPDDLSLIAGFAHFIEASLRAGAGVIALLNESHRDAIFQRLQANGIDPYTAIDESRLACCEVADALLKIMINGQPDPVHLSNFVSDLAKHLNKDAYGERQRLVACGECAPTLLAQGKTEAAIRLEHLWDDVAKTYKLDVLCGYCGRYSSNLKRDFVFERVCAEHSAVYTDSRQP